MRINSAPKGFATLCVSIFRPGPVKSSSVARLCIPALPRQSKRSSARGWYADPQFCGPAHRATQWLLIRSENGLVASTTNMTSWSRSVVPLLKTCIGVSGPCPFMLSPALA